MNDKGRKWEWFVEIYKYLFSFIMSERKENLQNEMNIEINFS